MTHPTHAGVPGLPVLQHLEPFLVGTAMNDRDLDRAPFGLDIPPRNVIDPLRMDNAGFCFLLQNLDGRTFGPEGMPMDRWVFYDCCYMPGAIFGLGRPAAALSDHARAVLDVPRDYRGLVPFSMYIAIPMSADGDWMGHNLASIGPQLPEEDLRGLGTVTKALALRAFRTRRFFGATQWSSSALHIHPKFGPLDLVTAYTPAHSDHHTLTYAFDATDQALLGALRMPGIAFERPAPDLWITAGDEAAMIALQDRIEAGERFVIPGPPVTDVHGKRVPVASVARPEGATSAP